MNNVAVDKAETRSSPVLLAVAWAIVVLPTLWGLTYTVENALKIFVAPQAASTSHAVR